MREPEELELAGYEGGALPCLLHDVQDARGSAVVLPGAARSGNRLGGTPARPDLHFTSAVLQASGLAVLEVWWDSGSAPRADLERWARENAVAAAREAATRYPLRVAVGRSLGSGALAALVTEPEWAGLATIWIAPLTGNEAIRAALQGVRAPCLVVGGTADPAFDVDFAHGLRAAGAEVLLLEGANHGLAVDDPVESVRLLERVVSAVRSFVERSKD